MTEQRVFNVLLRSPSGREAVYSVSARTGTSAAGIAIRQAEKDTGQRWYAVKADPR